jgi:DNA-3-methyladenine glycosylase
MVNHRRLFCSTTFQAIMAARPSRDFYAQDTLKVARALIGMRLMHCIDGETRAGRIVETEAYQGPEDLAAHSARGLTPRNAIMFGAPGHGYVYLIYGMWHCMNVVTREAGVPHAVLIRAVEPVENLHLNTHGPGLLCRAFGIDRSLNGADLLGKHLWIENDESPTRPELVCTPRIGVDYAGEWAQRPWRFHDAKSVHVSGLSKTQRRQLAGSKTADSASA